MKRAFALLLAVLLLAGCATLERGWPRPQVDYTHAATPSQASTLVAQWAAAPGRVWTHSLPTGSMLPYIHGGPREFLLEERYTGQPIAPGLLVIFNRGDAPNCLHLVAATSADGQWLYMSGTNNRWSDGWFHVSKVSYILRGVVTLPASVDQPAGRFSAPGRAVTGK